MAKTPGDRFIESASQHGHGTVAGAATVTNRAYKRLISAIKEIRDSPDKGVDFLECQLENLDLSVVTWSALHLLPYKSDKAVLALKKVAETGPPLIAFGAEMTLKEWQAGRLKVD